jgi:ankyrin repeat protein
MRCLVQELGADVNQTHDGITALFIAAEDGFSDLVRLLVTELGANINQGIQDVGTPLTLAAYEGQLAVVRCLIELDAEVEAVVALRRCSIHERPQHFATFAKSLTLKWCPAKTLT